ncbi:unnamed protein product [Sphagnum balticum]
MIFEILSQPHVFTFSIVGDGSTHYESSYFDIHIRVGVNGVLHNLHLMIVPFYGRHTTVQAERDSNNEAAMTKVSLVMHAQLVHMRLRDFIRNILDPRRAHLSRFWSPGEIEDVERDHMKLVKDYGIEIELKENIDAQDHRTMFNCAWDSMRGKYQALCCFSSCLATSFANTTLVESDFSILKWEKNSNQKLLTNLALEGIFATKQHDRLTIN